MIRYVTALVFLCTFWFYFFFFFQAEDGIRDVAVTGVQTCALPIYREPDRRIRSVVSWRPSHRDPTTKSRSEERRVGKGVDLGGRRIIKKKKKKRRDRFEGRYEK